MHDDIGDLREREPVHRKPPVDPVRVRVQRLAGLDRRLNEQQREYMPNRYRTCPAGSGETAHTHIAQAAERSKSGQRQERQPL